MVESLFIWFLPPENRIGGRVRLDSRDRLQFEATKIHTGARKREVPLSVRIPLAIDHTLQYRPPRYTTQRYRPIATRPDFTLRDMTSPTGRYPADESSHSITTPTKHDRTRHDRTGWTELDAPSRHRNVTDYTALVRSTPYSTPLTPLDFDCADDYIADMTGEIIYWECPQNQDHIFDYDDWRVKVDDWTFVAHCPYDNRAMTKRIARVV